MVDGGRAGDARPGRPAKPGPQRRPHCDGCLSWYFTSVQELWTRHRTARGYRERGVARVHRASAEGYRWRPIGRPRWRRGLGGRRSAWRTRRPCTGGGQHRRSRRAHASQQCGPGSPSESRRAASRCRGARGSRCPWGQRRSPCAARRPTRAASAEASATCSMRISSRPGPSTRGT